MTSNEIEFVMCQGRSCTADAMQRITAAGTHLSKVVCHDLMHVQWAKDQLLADRPGTELVRVQLMPHPGMEPE